MMWSITGPRGIGKTYFLSKEIERRHSQKYFIITNFTHVYSHVDCSAEDPSVLYDIIRELGIFKERGYEMVDLDPRFPHSGVFIGIDEAHLYFSADMFSRYKSDLKFQYVLKFLAQARKSDVEIWYSAQDPARIDINWRRYTETYIRYRPVIGFRYKKNVLIQRPKREDGSTPLPFFRREIRYVLPLLWMEHHKLSAENPVFDVSTVQTEDGGAKLSTRTTLQSRSFALSGWLDPFPYTLYDSYQMLAMQGKEESDTFKNLLNFAWTDHTMKREPIPTLKSILGIKREDEKIPTKVFMTDRQLPLASPPSNFKKNVAAQPVEFLDNLAFFNAHHKKALKSIYKKSGSIKSPPTPSPLPA